MNFEEMQNAWRAQGEGGKMTNSAALLQLVKRNHQDFRVMIFWRDFQECVVAFGMAVVFLCVAFGSQSWVWAFMALMVAFVGAFIVGDRMRTRKRRACEAASMREAAEAALYEVSHQIWLLKNVFWWYILPPLIGIIAVYLSALHTMRDVAAALGASVAMELWGCALAFTLIFFAGVYALNQRAVESELLPRKRELERLLESLSEED